MTCREFEHFWTSDGSEDLTSDARAHLAACPICAAMARQDAAVDATLRRLGSTPVTVDTDTARAAIRHELEQQAAPGRRIDWRRPLLLTAAGLAAAALLAAWLARPVTHPGPSSPNVAWRVPLHSVPLITPRRVTPHEKVAPPQAPVLPRLIRQSPGMLPEQTSDHHTNTAAGHEPRHGPGRRAPAGNRGIERSPRAPGVSPASPRNAPEGEENADMLVLNEGPPGAAPPFALLPAPAPPLPPLPPVQERRPGSLVLDDLLYLNPVRIAAADETGLRAAARAIAEQAPATDRRLQQRVFVHATDERIADLLARLSKVSGATLLARMEVADERISLWADDRPLIDVMRDLRHLLGLFWSRSKRHDQYVYSLWRDARGQAREEAELQHLALKLQRAFEENVRKHVRALDMGDAEMKRLAAEDPYFVAQMLHPVVRNGYRLFGALGPDQQAQLLQGQTPSRGLDAGEVLGVAALVSEVPDKEASDDESRPRGDVVRIPPGELTPQQRTAVEGIFQGAAAQLEKEAHAWRREKGDSNPASAQTIEIRLHQARMMATADARTATVAFFRWGDPNWQGLSMRLQFRSGGRPWMLYSNIGVPASSHESYGDYIRKGQFQVWPGAQDEINRYLGGAPPPQVTPVSTAPATAPEPPDPILDAPVSVAWWLRFRDGGYSLMPQEVVALLHRDLRHPLMLDAMPGRLEQPRGGPAEFRWEKRSLRELLLRLFPGWEFHADEGAVFLHQPDRLRSRLHQVPRVVTDFVWSRKVGFTLDDMAFLARSLSPWQIVKLEGLPEAGKDQLLDAQELLKLYGELAPRQRAALRQGITFPSLTPTQQALFLQFAQRHRPFVERWRFQHGGLRVTSEPLPAKGDSPGYRPDPVARATFQVQFGEEDAQSFPLFLYPRLQRHWFDTPVADRVGKPFPFPRERWSGPNEEAGSASRPALSDERLRKKPVVIVLAWPFAEPYVGTQAPPDSAAWARSLAERLRDTGITVVHVRTDPAPAAAPRAEALPPNFIPLWETGDLNGQALDSTAGPQVEQSPTVFVVGSDEIVRAVFEGHAAWDMGALERAARHISPVRASRRISSRWVTNAHRQE